MNPRDSHSCGGALTRAVPYIPSDAPGAWRRTPPDYRPPLAPNWGRVQPFGIPGVDAFPLPPPPALDSPEYLHPFEQLRQWGAKEPRSRTAEETEVGLFWAYDRGGMGPPPILYNQMAAEVARLQGNGLAENARLFALLNLAQADAGIVCWAIKYRYNFWRPLTAIREAAFDGNPETLPEPDWEPLGAPGSGVRPDFTPPFPSYPSGHAAFGGAIFRVLERYYGTDEISFACGSDELPGVVRTYQTLSQADEENALSRIYLRVHWSFDQRQGRVALESSTDLRAWSSVSNHLGPFTVIESAEVTGSHFYRALAE